MKPINQAVQDKLREIDGYITALQHEEEDLKGKSVTNREGRQTTLAGYKYYHERIGWEVDQSEILEELFGTKADEMKC